ncbi:hypothetical protein [Sphingomonas sp.]|uniref:hypothetical protein n=1 Tax=Sphingomonas sp. TaxID=28214 RepID=UPI0031DD8AAC
MSTFFRIALGALSAMAVILAVPAPAREAGPAQSVPYRWSNVKVGGGGFSPGVIFSRAERGLAYLRTDIGGAYRWDAKARRWIPLQDGMGESNYHGIESIAADPRNPDIVYLAAGMYHRGPAAILRSADRGATWTIVPVPFRMGGNEPGRGLGERLAIDPADPAILYFGSRFDGLWRSTDSGATWSKVAGFPHAGKPVPAERWSSNAGVSFVLFDRSSAKGGKSRTIYAAVADPDGQGLYRSSDGGSSWARVPGGPTGLMPAKGDISDDGRLVVAYSNGIGPNGVSGGAVWRLAGGQWTDITPGKGSAHGGGYMAISLAHSAPGTLAVATMNAHPDTAYVSTDWGTTWTDIGKGSRRDIAAAPWLRFDEKEADFGHWIAGIAVDPFDAGHIAYTTGATVYATDGWRTGLWKPWTEGVEETAIVSLASPTGGANLISGFGDIAGFVHDDFAVSPPTMHLTPHLVTTINLDYAGQAPAIMVRSGRVHQGQKTEATLALSRDGGRSWEPVLLPPYAEVGESEVKRHDLIKTPAITVSADGAVLAVATPTPFFSHDGGITWTSGLNAPRETRAVADKVDPRRFYMLDFSSAKLFVSNDGGRRFRAAAALPGDLSKARTFNVESPWPLAASPFAAGDLWLNIDGTLHRSRDGGRSFAVASKGLEIRRFAFGKPAQGLAEPTLFAFGTQAGVTGIWRSTDAGKSWLRVNDDANQWGNRIRVIEGDPRIFGRVYVGTDGRGLLYGEPR